jgi:ribosomal subunit interface protein
VDIIFNGRHTEVLERFRKHATAKLAKIEKLDQRAIRVDVEVSAERNPRQAGRKERVELTVASKGPAIRAEAAAEDRFVALDMALAKLEARLRKALDRRKCKHGARVTDLPEADLGADLETPAGLEDMATETTPAGSEAEGVLYIEMQGDGPVVVREKFHAAAPMTIDQALFEMELVGHDFFLFADDKTNLPSVVYKRRGYQYGVIRLVDHPIGAGEQLPESGHEAPAAVPPQAARQRVRGAVAGAAPGSEANGAAGSRQRGRRAASLPGR